MFGPLISKITLNRRKSVDPIENDRNVCLTIALRGKFSQNDCAERQTFAINDQLSRICCWGKYWATSNLATKKKGNIDSKTSIHFNMTMYYKTNIWYQYVTSKYDMSKSYIYIFVFIPSNEIPTTPSKPEQKTPGKWRLGPQPNKNQQALGAKSFVQSDSGLQSGKTGITGQAIFAPLLRKPRNITGFLWGLLMALLRETQWFFHKPWSWGRLPLGGYVRWRERVGWD